MRFIDGLVYQYRRLRYHGKPTPKIRVYARPSVPAWVVRILAGVAASLCVGLPGSGSPVPYVLVTILAAGMGTWMLIRPGYEVSITSILLAALLLFSSSHPVFDPLTWWILLVAYLSLRLAMVSCLLTWTSRVEFRAILTWRDAVLAALSVLIGCAALIPGMNWWAVALGIVGLVGVAAGLVIGANPESPRRRAARGDPDLVRMTRY